MGMLSIVKHLPTAATKALGKVAFKVSKNKPQILVITGVAVATTGFVTAIVGAMKLKDTMAVQEAKVDDIQEKIKETENPSEPISEDAQKVSLVAYNKALRKVKAESAFKVFTLVGIPCILFVGGISMSIGGHLILLKRFGQLSTAFATLQQTFERYRQLNIAEHGEECDKRYRYGITDMITTTAEVTDDKGKTKQVKCKVPVVDNDLAASMYQFCFSEDFSRKCPKDPVNMISYLRAQERYWNVWMETNRKPVTLYMVLNDLGIELDPDDPMNDYVMLAGWRPNGDGDNHIDFGIMRACNKPALDMLENVCFLNFNCDGNLYHSPRYTKDGKKIGGT